MIIIASKQEKELLDHLRNLGSTVGIDRSGKLQAEALDLKKQINDLIIDKSKKQEEFDKQDRELRHMIGLEKRRGEFEIDQAAKNASLKVREENLASDKKRFEESLKFNTDRFEKMESTLTKLLSDVLSRLPNVNMEISRKGK